ncbi:CHAT domain-containing protein [Algoriphagus limi]|uniref:CHAT domain-containing protein n=1 Tax=Algoriphagus limi TaxID=2975273 RepID=A0ABT2G1U2_9BACT|nr:CHAT domain-containing protein [Algoriphagus limi]MCS5489238.1 CHAT domain-containing protein [Algoriphagus limi]
MPYPQEEDDLLAIEIYKQVLAEVPDSAQARAFVRASENLGSLLLLYNQQQEAANSYRKAINYAKVFGLADSSVYNSNLFLGEVLFRMSRLDSAILHLKEAERIQQNLGASALPERLFNALGVYYFETGNYLQSITYFTQAETYLEGGDPDYIQYARYSFLSNKASALYHLKEYDSARSIYFQLLDWNINTNQIRINLANTFLKENRGEEALTVLSQIQNPGEGNQLSFLNLMAKAYLQTNALKKADSLLVLTEQTLDSLGIPQKNYQRGIYFQNKGNYYRLLNQEKEALNYFHQAVVELHPEFSSEDYFSNPSDLSLGMASISLFENLVAKAETAWLIFQKEEDQSYYSLGKDTYQVAFSLADYLSSNFDNDEARIFLGDQVIEAYKNAIANLFTFYSKSAEIEYKNQAFILAEQSKSSALRLGVLENKLKENSGVPRELLATEKELQQRLAINYRKQYESQDPSEIEGLKEEFNGLQIELSRTRDKIKTFYPQAAIRTEIKLESIQEQLPDEAILFSIFEGNDQLNLFVLDESGLDWHMIPWGETERKSIQDWKNKLRTWRAGLPYKRPEILSELSESFFLDIEWERKSVLMIIPHGVFSGVSFDESPVEDEFLIQKIPIIYQFTALQIRKMGRTDWEGDELFSFAPFSDAQVGIENLPALPGSQIEIDNLPGKKYFGKDADKSTFLKDAGQSRYIHLATHAIASGEQSEASFIAFYPSGDFRLFDSELSYQPLDKVELVFLSACETASGRFSESEGLVSLARSFAMSGVEQLVSTLWLTEDQVAAYLSQKFYEELEGGKTYAEALQLAKLELLNDPQMAQFAETPYWSNFILLGQIQSVSQQDRLLRFILYFAVFLLIAGLAYGIAIRFFRK